MRLAHSSLQVLPHSTWMNLLATDFLKYSIYFDKNNTTFSFPKFQNPISFEVRPCNFLCPIFFLNSLKLSSWAYPGNVLIKPGSQFDEQHPTYINSLPKYRWVERQTQWSRRGATMQLLMQCSRVLCTLSFLYQSDRTFWNGCRRYTLSFRA